MSGDENAMVDVSTASVAIAAVEGQNSIAGFGEGVRTVGENRAADRQRISGEVGADDEFSTAAGLNAGATGDRGGGAAGFQNAVDR